MIMLGRIIGTSLEKTKARQRLLKATEEAVVANNAKSEFVAKVSHELRTPLNGILGYTCILQDTVLTESQQECVNTVKMCSEMLLHVLNDLIDFSKIESGRLTLEKQCFHLFGCLKEIQNMLEVSARKEVL